MKRIIIFSPTIYAGGAEKQACLLAKYLTESGHDVTFLSYYGKRRAEPKNIEIIRSEPRIKFIKPAGSGHIRKLCSVYRILQRGDFDIMFNYLTFCNVFGGLLGRLCHLPKIYGGIRNSRLPISKNLMERFIHNYISHYTIFNCYSGVEYFARHGYRKDKCIVIHNCFENIVPIIPQRKVTIPTIISVGRFVEQKDYLTAIKAIDLVAQKGKQFKYIIVGYGSLEAAIRKWIKEYKLENTIELLIAPKNIPELLDTSDIYLSTSLFEGTSNSLLEALNAGLPIVATDVGDNKYIVKQRKNGFILPVGDEVSISESLISLLEDTNLRNEYGKTSHHILSKYFSTDNFIENYNTLIE